MFDTALDGEDLLEKPVDAHTHDAQITTLRQRVTHTREHAEEGVKELADHGRALGRLSEALGLAGECDEAIEAREEALEIWRRLGRESAAHLATLKLAELHDRRGDTDRVNELLADALREERRDPAIERAYKLTRRHIEARMCARRGELASAHTLLRVCLAELSGRSRTPLYIQLNALRERLEELDPSLLHK